MKFIGKISLLNEPQVFRSLLKDMYEKKWITYCKRPFGGPEKVVEYLGRYTHRVAISNSRIKSAENGKVIFEWKDYRDGGRKKLMELPAVEFIRRFMLHVLPENFYKIRYYGLLGNRSKQINLEKCRKILSDSKSESDDNCGGQSGKAAAQVLNTIWLCPNCKTGIMRYAGISIRAA